MTKMTGSVMVLTGSDMRLIMNKYKLNQSVTVADMMQIRMELQQVLEPEISYEIEETDVIAAVTLGEGADAYLDRLEEQGQKLKAYAADCLMLEYLNLLYQSLEKELQGHSLYVMAYDFPDPERQMDLLREIMNRLETRISFGHRGMLRPLKSAVYRLKTSDQPRTAECKTHICSQCENVSCQMRIMIPWEGASRVMAPGAMQYGYGYQKIFGRS